MTDYRAYPATVQHLKATLTEATTHRHERDDWIAGECAWVTYERQRMHDETNLLRARRGLGPIDEKRIRRAERLAEGHIDYVQKFALGCADAVFEGTTQGT
jgi:hypothetical protein